MTKVTAIIVVLVLQAIIAKGLYDSQQTPETFVDQGQNLTGDGAVLVDGNTPPTMGTIIDTTSDGPEFSGTITAECGTATSAPCAYLMTTQPPGQLRFYNAASELVVLLSSKNILTISPTLSMPDLEVCMTVDGETRCIPIDRLRVMFARYGR